MRNLRLYKLSMDFELVAVDSGKPLRGKKPSGVDYEGVARVETFMLISPYTRRDYIPNIVQRFLNENEVRWRQQAQKAIDNLMPDTWEVGTRLRSGYAFEGETRRVNKYTVVDETFNFFIDNGTGPNNYVIETQRKRRLI